MSLTGRKAFVTGASRGLGKAIAQRLAQEGSHVTLVARNESLLTQIRSQLPNQESHRILPLDLIKLDEADIQNELKDVSVLVNCAGITNHSLLPRMLSQEIRDTLSLNLLAPILLAKAATKPMLKLKESDPVMINISSILSLPEFSVPGTSVYAALKAGLNGFTSSLSNELRGRIRVNSILPGLIKETDMGKGTELDIEAVLLQKVVDTTLETILDKSCNGKCILVD